MMIETFDERSTSVSEIRALTTGNPVFVVGGGSDARRLANASDPPEPAVHNPSANRPLRTNSVSTARIVLAAARHRGRHHAGEASPADDELAPMLLNEVQRQAAKIASLEQKVSEVDDLKKQLSAVMQELRARENLVAQR